MTEELGAAPIMLETPSDIGHVCIEAHDVRELITRWEEWAVLAGPLQRSIVLRCIRDLSDLL